MLKHKRQTAILLLAALLLSTACGSGADSTDTTTAGNDTTAAPVETTPEYTKPDVDYGGAVFTFLDYDTDDYFWQAATYSDINAEEENGDPINDAQYRRNIKVEEELNVDIQTYPINTIDRAVPGKELTKLIMAGDNTVDAGFVFGNSIKQLLADPGYLHNINDCSTLDYTASWWDQRAIEELSFDGDFKILVGDISLFTSFAPMLFFFNKKVASDFKLDNMYDLVREGKWTADKLYEYCKLV
ncbi:MAG: hypothetical protein E7632_12300, partial [Ruminococcaceae bacterium]|nr:hypothetical protein [Oscillospiraceae bacterium]